MEQTMEAIVGILEQLTGKIEGLETERNDWKSKYERLLETHEKSVKQNGSVNQLARSTELLIDEDKANFMGTFERELTSPVKSFAGS